VIVKSLPDRLVAALGPPNELVLLAENSHRLFFRGWALGHPVTAGADTFTLYVGIEGDVWEYQESIAGVTWSHILGLGAAEQAFARQCERHAPDYLIRDGWRELRQRIRVLRRTIGDLQHPPEPNTTTA